MRNGCFYQEDQWKWTDNQPLSLTYYQTDML